MKKYLLMFMTAIIFLSALTAQRVAAQTAKFVSAEVPFEFRIGDRIYPAGAYRLESVSETNKNLLQLRGADEKNRRLMITNEWTASRWQTPKLVFHRIGEAYYLKNIFMDEGKWGLSIRLPREVEKSNKLASAKIVEVPVTN